MCCNLITLKIMHLIFIYLGILFGILLEGEMIMLSAIIAAHHGYLKFWLVIVIGATGTYCSLFDLYAWLTIFHYDRITSRNVFSLRI